MKTWEGTVYKYQPKTTHLYVYLCTMEYIYLRCNRAGAEAFGEERSTWVKRLLVAPENCMEIVRTMKLEYDGISLELTKRNENHWKSNEKKEYDCTWTRDLTTGVYEVEVFRRPAQIVGDSPNIEQHVFDKKCKSSISKERDYSRCISDEDPKKMIAWEDPQHYDRIMKDLGTHTIKHIGDYILIESLLMGGIIQQEERGALGDNVQLDNGIVIKKKGDIDDTYKKLRHEFREYAKKVGTDVMAPIMEAHITAVLIQQNNDMIRDWERTCFVQK